MLLRFPKKVVRRSIAVLHRKVNPTSRPEFIDLSDRVEDPFEAIYLADGSKPLIGVPLASMRFWALGFRLDDALRNPFVRTIAEYLAGHADSYADSFLRRYYDAWQPANAGEALGVTAWDQSTGLDQPPQAYALPWDAEAGELDPTSRLEWHDRDIRAESREVGPELNGAHGDISFGPVSEALGRAEFERYRRITDSIVEHGFDVETTGTVEILAAGTSWVAIVHWGGHRLAAVAALGIDPVTVAIWPIVVRREDASSWPGVRSGLFSVENALEVFDRIFDGRPPSGCPDLR